jgi:hypothetical protein
VRMCNVHFLKHQRIFSRTCERCHVCLFIYHIFSFMFLAVMSVVGLSNQNSFTIVFSVEDSFLCLHTNVM